MILYHYYRPGEGILCCLEADLNWVTMNPDLEKEEDPGYLIKVCESEPFLVMDIVRMEADTFGNVETGMIVDEDDCHWKEEPPTE